MAGGNFEGPIKVKKNLTDSIFDVLLSKEFTVTQANVTTGTLIGYIPKNSRMIRILIYPDPRTLGFAGGVLSMGTTVAANEYFTAAAGPADNVASIASTLSSATTVGAEWGISASGEIWAKASGTGDGVVRIFVQYIQNYGG